MNETSNKNVIWTVVILVVIVIAGILLFRSPSATVVDDGTATTTVDGVNAGTNANGGTSGANGSGSTGGTQAQATQLDAIASNNTTLKAMLDNSSLRVPETAVDVVLRNGSAAYTNGQVKGTVMLGQILGKTKVEAGYDVFVEMTVTSNTVPGQKRVAVFYLTNAGTKFTSSAIIGDRVMLRSLTITDDANVSPQYRFENLNMRFANIAYKVAVNYLDRRNGESATTTPTVPRDVQFSVKNHIISK
jgi:hypothetical protein